MRLGVIPGVPTVAARFLTPILLKKTAVFFIGFLIVAIMNILIKKLRGKIGKMVTFILVNTWLFVSNFCLF